MNRPSRRRPQVVAPLLVALLASAALAAVPAATAQDPAPAAPGGQADAQAGDVDLAPAEPLLAEPLRGREAVRALGDRLGTVAAEHDLRAGELRSLLRTDLTAWVDTEGAVYFVDPAPRSSHETGQDQAPAGVAPLEETFRLHSRPGADRTILLDFDGEDVSGTAWNATKGVMPGLHPAWDPAGDGTAFTDAERAAVQEVWARVAEDFAPFDVDVTTEDPGPAGLVRSSTSDTVYGTRVLVSPSTDAHTKICEASCGGVAYLSVFDLVNSPAQPAWVFPQALGDDLKSVAEAASHEAGHNLGLAHDGPSYYTGHGVWAPIMGVGYSRPLSQWSAGSYPSADNSQDDLAILTGYLDRRPDEADDSHLTPSPLPEGRAYIGSRDDVDAYALGRCSAGSGVDVVPADVGPNLDVRAALYDATGTLRAESRPASSRVTRKVASGLDAGLVVPADGGGWVLTVEGAGEGDWSSSGYDDYASLGAYSVGAPGCDGGLPEGVPGAPAGVSVQDSQPDALTLVWSAPADPGASPVTGYVVSLAGSTQVVTLPGDRRRHTFTGLAASTEHRLSVRAVNARGAGRTATASGSTAAPRPAVPSAPRGLTAVYDDATSRLEVRWAEPESPGSQPVTGYTVHLDGARVGELGWSSRGATLTLPAGTRTGQHVVGVAAVNPVGASPVATTSFTVAYTRPVNDSVSHPVPLPGLSGSTTGDNTHATGEPTDPPPPGAATGAGGRSLWYAWTPTSDGPVTLRTSGGGAGRTTALAAHTGVPGALVQVAGHDGDGGHATVTFDARARTRYLVVVDGSVRSGGTGPFALSWSQRVPSAPASPPAVWATAGNGSATVSWTAPDSNGSPITGYRVTARNSWQDHRVVTVGGGTTSVEVTGLTNDTAYTFSVVATNALGESPASTPSHAVVPTRPPSKAKAPSRMKAPRVVVRGKKAVVRWKAARSRGAAVTRYFVDVSRGKDKKARGKARKVTLKKLRPGTYKVRVAARNEAGRSRYSRWATFRVR